MEATEKKEKKKKNKRNKNTGFRRCFKKSDALINHDRSSGTTQKNVALVAAFRGVAILIALIAGRRRTCPPSLPPAAPLLAPVEARKTITVHEIAYANDNCRVQARWKDQLIVPRGERYVGRYMETLPFIIISKRREGKKKKKKKKVGYKSWIIRYKLIVINVLQLSFKC